MFTKYCRTLIIGMRKIFYDNWVITEMRAGFFVNLQTFKKVVSKLHMCEKFVALERIWGLNFRFLVQLVHGKIKNLNFVSSHI